VDPNVRTRRGSLGWGLVLIGIGVLFLVAQLRPGFDPWQLLWKYWPILLILLGVAKLWEHMSNRNNPQARSSGWISGSVITVVAIVALIGLSTHHSGAANPILRDSESLQLQGAKSVTAKIDMGAGQLNVNSGSSQLMDADFSYDRDSGKPRVNYSLSGANGNLDISQHENGGMHLGRNENTWSLKFGDVPLDLNVDMGAGQGDLNLRGINLTRLKIEMGAGQINLDLTGERKQSFDVDVQGGVGEAVIRLPRDVGVEIRADGGIGSIDTEGLHKEGGRWVNDAWGKSPITIHMNVEGGIGEIRLVVE
jgi:uncharacterized protein DUF2154/cell wall-active antibiotic response 4TMS protein YvqF